MVFSRMSGVVGSLFVRGSDDLGRRLRTEPPQEAPKTNQKGEEPLKKKQKSSGF